MERKQMDREKLFADEKPELPDGSEVQVIVSDALAKPASFADRYAAYIGAADDLPADLAANLDHYVHGHSRK